MGSSLLSLFNAYKGLWDACFSAKMAADLFWLKVCVLLGSFLALTSGQSNRTVFSPSSTSGNSCVKFWVDVLKERMSFDTTFSNGLDAAIFFSFCII